MKKRSVLLSNIVFIGVLTMTSTLAIAQYQRRCQDTRSRYNTANESVTTTLSPRLQAIPYKIVTSMRSRIERILWISIEPVNFNRDGMLMLAHQLNKDFPDESRIYAVFFDSEDAARHYNPVGGSYSLAKDLERGEYFLDRVKGRESLNFSTQRGNPVNEIKIILGKRFIPTKNRKRTARKLTG